MFYYYGMRSRGASPGAQPKGFEIVTDEYPGYVEDISDEAEKLMKEFFPSIPSTREQYGCLFYDVLRYRRRLSQSELDEYELNYLFAKKEYCEMSYEESGIAL